MLVTGVEGFRELDIGTARPGVRGRHRSAKPAHWQSTRAREAVAGESGMFTKFALDYAAQHAGRPITVLRAGCTTAGAELDLDALRAAVAEVVVTMVDDNVAAARDCVASRPDLTSATLAELRTVRLTPRSFDIVQCSMLLDRISGAEIVLGRLVAALRPGGLLLLSTADRSTAAGFLDRKLPRVARTMVWRAAHGRQPGPYPPIYEPISSSRGIQRFLAKHGLSVAHREVCDTGPVGGALAARKIVAWLSAGRLGWTYDELRFVARKPEDRSARLLP